VNPRPRILVVDDEPGMLRAVERVLSPHYELRTARLPSQALEAAATESFALALLDIRMPEMDGFELMARLGALQPGIDVILMTGSTDERDARLVRAIREKAFFFLTKPFDREVLLTLVERCLELHRLDGLNRANVLRLERELRAARAFQQTLLPARASARGDIEIALHYEPLGELCGDFCDYVLGDDGSAATLLTDVSGHGAQAAMLTGMIKQVFHATGSDRFPPGQVLDRISGAIRLFPDDLYLSVVCVRVRPESNSVEYVNAGHPPGLLLRGADTLVRLESSVPPVHSAFNEWKSAPRTEAMAAGDLLLLYTDGLTEARNPDGDVFGDERLERAARRIAARARDGKAHAPELLAPLREELSAFMNGRGIEDDLTVVLVRRR
jgi:phosphoserine phosphatase RsbU/P